MQDSDIRVTVTGVRTPNEDNDNRLVDRAYVCGLLRLTIDQLKHNEASLGLVPPIKRYINKRTVRYHLPSLRSLLRERGLLD